MFKLFILETNGIYFGVDESYVQEVPKFKKVHIRVSLKLNPSDRPPERIIRAGSHPGGQSTLYFDVVNNKHVRSENDPEKNSNGIGLINVKQRLQLVYPGKHELVIRETVHDYFVHLVINLAQ